MKDDPRTLARFLAVQYLFTKLKEHKDNIKLNVFEPNTLLSILGASKYNTKLYEQIIEGVESNSVKIDEAIQKLATSWPLDQINPIDLIVMRVAIWEGFIGELNPVKVVIDEAVIIAKELGTESSGPFVNGVLGNLLNNTQLQQFLKENND